MGVVYMNAQRLGRRCVDVVIADGAGGEIADALLHHGLQQGAVHPGIAQHGNAAAAVGKSQGIRRQRPTDPDQLSAQLAFKALQDRLLVIKNIVHADLHLFFKPFLQT